MNGAIIKLRWWFGGGGFISSLLSSSVVRCKVRRFKRKLLLRICRTLVGIFLDFLVERNNSDSGRWTEGKRTMVCAGYPERWGGGYFLLRICSADIWEPQIYLWIWLVPICSAKFIVPVNSNLPEVIYNWTTYEKSQILQSITRCAGTCGSSRSLMRQFPMWADGAAAGREECTHIAPYRQ